MTQTLRAALIGMGMIFDETYRPLFETLHESGLFRRDFGDVDVTLAAVATRTGARARAYKAAVGPRIADFASFEGDDAVARAVGADVDFVCVATPDDRHFDAARQAIAAGRHVLIEKPSVLQLPQLDELVASDTEMAQLCVLAAYRGDTDGRAVHLMGPLAGKVLRIAPPLTITKAEARDSVAALAACLAGLRVQLSESSAAATR